MFLSFGSYASAAVAEARGRVFATSPNSQSATWRETSAALSTSAISGWSSELESGDTRDFCVCVCVRVCAMP